MKNEKTFFPDNINSYFRIEWLPLLFVAYGIVKTQI